MSSPTSALLKILTATNAEISLGLTIGNVVVPVIIGIIKQIKTAVTGTEVEYTVVIKSTGALLDAIIAAGESDLNAINKELERFGIPPLSIPSAPAAPHTP